jgi:DHA1 family tetracycline resistance protein-like MFS transporter
MFGFAFNFWYVLVLRFLTGAFTPMAPLCRTVMGELCPPHIISRGMSILSLAWHLGFMIGAGIGGLLSHPEEMFGELPILAPYPYMLPMLVTSALAGLVTVLFYFNIEETLVKREHHVDQS